MKDLWYVSGNCLGNKQKRGWACVLFFQFNDFQGRPHLPKGYSQSPKDPRHIQDKYDKTMYSSAQDIIRSAVEINHIKKWGFSIYKCNTVSENRWQDFTGSIISEACAYLSSTADEDILSSMTFPIITDKSLENASWREARTHFDANVRKTLIPTLEDSPLRPWIEQEAESGEASWTEDDKLAYRIQNEPLYGFFLFADETAVDNILEYVDDKGNPEGGIITLVASAITSADIEELAELASQGLDDEEEEDSEDEEEMQRQMKKVRAWNIVAAYATIQHGGWEDDFVDDGNGISEVVSL